MATSPARSRPRLPPPAISAAELLESLPPAMLDEILSCLPIRDAARTSVLSRAWRRRWESVPYPVLNWPRGTPSAPIDAVLAHRTCPVSEFRHQYVPETEFHLSDLWLLRLASVGVQSLYLKFKWLKADGIVMIPHFHMLHPYIFSCLELAVLDLEACDFPDLPSSFAGFPNLTALSLSNVGFPQGLRGLEVMISSSSSLQRLRLENLRMPEEYEQWVIHAPNLQRLLITSDLVYGWQIDHLPSLEVAEVELGHYSDAQEIVNLISPLDQARILQLSMPSSMDNLLEGLSRSFVNLKCLSLHIPYCCLSSFLSIFCLARKAPNLEVFDIELGFHYEEDEGVDINVLNAQRAVDLFSSLTTVHMKNVTWNLYEMAFIQFVLLEARQLEVFSIHESRLCLKPNQAALALAEVAQYMRSSPAANLVISQMP
ncbi:F-box/FBD/LRR-repeat protein At1g13570-like [Lolium rigidum]|uniref:F-box/FBD/LRR-repeat protein At1g13570-like n=1 Tax=Lolium rigidum TaxID=89674 RepID=UPI001F5C15E2|nr:F-box/FBD/LRR-repeat protein At1g13570-like [Lolium rigidum]